MVVLNQNKNMIYVAGSNYPYDYSYSSDSNLQHNYLTVIDGATNKINQSIELGTIPSTIDQLKSK